MKLLCDNVVYGYLSYFFISRKSFSFLIFVVVVFLTSFYNSLLSVKLLCVDTIFFKLNICNNKFY